MTTPTTTIPTGYKQTDIGLIPADWAVKTLGDIGDAIIGLTYSPKDVVGNGKLVHRSSNIQNNQLSYDDNVYVDKPINERLILRENDILICVRNGSRDLIGKSALIKGKSAGETFGAFMSIFRSDEYQPFIFYLILSSLVQRQINLSLGATINQITNKTLNSFKIPYPPKLEERQAIATVISETDTLIEGLERLITKKKNIKQGAMQELLSGRRRLPGFAGKWQSRKLGELGSFSKGQGVRKDQSKSGDIACVRYGELYTHHNNYIRRYYSFISKEVAATTRKIKFGDILFAGSGETKEEIGKCAAVLDDMNVYAGGDIVIFSPHNSDSLFLGYLLNTPFVAQQKASKGQGDAIVHISVASLKEVQLILPMTKAEQTAVARVLSDMDAEIEKLGLQLAKYQHLKEGMMQELLTGQIRLI